MGDNFLDQIAKSANQHNDTQNLIRGATRGGLKGFANAYNEMAVRNAQIETSKHLETLAENAKQQQQAAQQAALEAERARRAAEREANRIAALPKCTECASPVEGSPSKCPSCGELIIQMNGKQHAFPQVKKYLSTPSEWPELREATFSEESVQKYHGYITASLELLREKCEPFRTQDFKTSREVMDFLKEACQQLVDAANDLKAFSEASSEHLKKELEKDPYKLSGAENKKFMIFGGAGLVLGLLMTGELGFGIFVGLIVGGIAWAATWFMRQSEHEEKVTKRISAEREGIIEARTAEVNNLDNELGGARYIILTLGKLTSAEKDNNRLRDIWERMCEHAGVPLPEHMASDPEVGPANISQKLRDALNLLEPGGA